VSARSIARRYAAALFDVTRRVGTEERAGRDLAAIASLIANHDELRSVLATPAIPPQVKKSVMTALLEATGETSVEVRRMLLLLAERGRLPLVPDVADAFSEKLLQLQRIVPAEVVTAVPLSDAARAALAKALEKAAGAQVTLTERVDPAIIGGVVAKVGSIVFDGSVTRQLERLGQRLRTEA
jgi:F-type H+-transporting ATPase subunit delta